MLLPASSNPIHLVRTVDHGGYKHLTNSFIVARVDFFNCVLANTPRYQLSRIRSVLNIAARIIDRPIALRPHNSNIMRPTALAAGTSTDGRKENRFITRHCSCGGYSLAHLRDASRARISLHQQLLRQSVSVYSNPCTSGSPFLRRLRR